MGFGPFPNPHYSDQPFIKKAKIKLIIFFPLISSMISKIIITRLFLVKKAFTFNPLKYKEFYNMKMTKS